MTNLPEPPQNDWTETQVALLRELALQHLSARTIAAQFPGKSRNAVLGKAFRLGIRIDGRDTAGRPYGSFWNHDGNLDKLKSLYFSPMGYSNHEIAATIGCGLSTLRRGYAKMRVAEGGQFKLREVYRGKAKSNGASNGAKKPFIIQKRPRTAKERAKARAAHRASVPDIGILGEISGAIGILELNGRTCHWPVHGEGAAMLYCGAEPIQIQGRDLPYCGPHCRRAYAV